MSMQQANPINQNSVGAMLKFLNLQKQAPSAQRIKEKFGQLSLSQPADSQLNKNKQFFNYVLGKDPEYFDKNSTNKAKSEQSKEVVFDEKKLDDIWKYLKLDDVEGPIYGMRILDIIVEKLNKD